MKFQTWQIHFLIKWRFRCCRRRGDGGRTCLELFRDKEYRCCKTS